jgi:choline-glycine betaine transporter
MYVMWSYLLGPWLMPCSLVVFILLFAVGMCSRAGRIEILKFSGFIALVIAAGFGATVMLFYGIHQPDDHHYQTPQHERHFP